MLLPLSDAPNPRGWPVVTYTLIAINTLVYLLATLPLSHQRPDLEDPALRAYVWTVRETLPPDVPVRAIVRETSAYDLFVFKHGFRPAAPELLDLLTSLFLHGGFMHLVGNMLFLWIYGDNVEHRLGRWRYLLAYLLTGVAATLIYSLFARGSKLPLVGASGAISGVLGFYFVWFPRNTVRLFVFLFPFFMNVVQVPARWVLGFYLLIDNLLPFLFSGSRAGGGVAYGAHLGGFAAGWVLAWYLDRRELQARPAEYKSPVPPILPTADPAQLIQEAIRAGAFEEAGRAYFGLDSAATHRLLQPEESLALADWLAKNDRPRAALTVYRRHLRDYPAGPGVAAAHLGAGRAQLEGLQQAAPAYQHFLDALSSDPSPEEEAAARAGLEAIARLQKYTIHVRRNA